MHKQTCPDRPDRQDADLNPHLPFMAEIRYLTSPLTLFPLDTIESSRTDRNLVLFLSLCVSVSVSLLFVLSILSIPCSLASYIALLLQLKCATLARVNAQMLQTRSTRETNGQTSIGKKKKKKKRINRHPRQYNLLFFPGSAILRCLHRSRLHVGLSR